MDIKDIIGLLIIAAGVFVLLLLLKWASVLYVYLWNLF